MSGDKSGLAIASLVCGIIALVTSFVAACCYWVIPVPLAIVGIITGVMGKNSEKKSLAIAGIVCSVVAFLISMIWLVLFLIGLAAGGNQPQQF